MKSKFLGLTLLALLGISMVSCNNDEVLNITPDTKPVGLLPEKSSDLTITSAGSTLATSKQSRVGGDAFEYYKYTDGNFPVSYLLNRPAALTNEEINNVLNVHLKGNNKNKAAEEVNLNDFNFCNFYIQNVGTSNDNYTQIKDHNNAKHQVKGGEHMNYLVINGQHINDYNASGGPDALVINLPINNPTYRDSYGDLNQTKENAYKIYKIDWNNKGNIGYYLCFDYKTEKSDGQKFDGDGVYNDWVVKLTPADGVTGNEPSDGGNTNPDPGNVGTNNNGQVELNLSVNAEKIEGDYIATKLSIHVRDTSDVEVFIPVEAQYYCKADDMNIVLSHKLNAESYVGVADSKEMTYDVNGNVVKLKVSYESNGIRVTTSGINAETLKYLRKTYGDGMTFEVWNYFKSNIVDENGTVLESFDRAKLQTKLNASTIKFTSDPGQYVNAFGAVYDYNGPIYGKVDELTGVWTPYVDEALTTVLGAEYWGRDPLDAKYYVINYHKNVLDCVVTPVNSAYSVQGTAIYNQIYKK